MSTPELGVIKFQTKNETRTNKVFPMHQSMERLDLQFERGEKTAVKFEVCIEVRKW